MTNSKEKRILIISAVFPPEPVVSANLSFDIAERLAMTNSVTVLSPAPSRPLGFQFANRTAYSNFAHIQSSSFICASNSLIGRFIESYSFGKQCFKYIRDNNKNIDAIYANTWPLFGQYFAVSAAEKYKIPLIIHVQDIYPESLSKKLPIASFLINKILLPLDKYILSRSSKVIAISEKMKEHLISTREINSDKISVIRNWQDDKAFNCTTPSKSSNTFTFMYLGSISPAAGVDLLISAFQKTGLVNAQLIIAGSGSDLEKCLTIASDHSNIHFIDAPMDLVPSIQSTSDVLLLPLKKGIGLTATPSKLTAYMFSAKPVIACVDETSDTANAILSADCGWVISPEDCEELTRQMIVVSSLQQSELLQKGVNGLNYAIRNYSRSSNLKKLTDIILLSTTE